MQMEGGALQNARPPSLRTREAGVAIRFSSKRGGFPRQRARWLGMTGWKSHFATRRFRFSNR